MVSGAGRKESACWYPSFVQTYVIICSYNAFSKLWCDSFRQAVDKRHGTVSKFTHAFRMGCLGILEGPMTPQRQGVGAYWYWRRRRQRYFDLTSLSHLRYVCKTFPFFRLNWRRDINLSSCLIFLNLSPAVGLKKYISIQTIKNFSKECYGPWFFI